MQTYVECLKCFERQAADACRIAGLSPETTTDVVVAVRDRIASFSMEEPPIVMAVEIHELIRLRSGIADPYAEAKAMANRVCAELVPVLEEHMARSSRPLETAVKLAIAGNIIDYGAFGMRDITDMKLVDVIDEVLAASLAGNTIEDFATRVASSERILYLADNAGECFFDVPLLRSLPGDRVTYAVRGGPILNDATRADADAAGIPELCRVITTGDHAPGVIFSRCSSEFRRTFNESDLIISKGQGNYESLSDVSGKTIVFLTRVKCELIARDVGHALGSNVMKIAGGRVNQGRNAVTQACF